MQNCGTLTAASSKLTTVEMIYLIKKITYFTAWRFALNGVVATVVHFLVLSFLIEIVRFKSAGTANGFAAIVGISVSYFGNRTFVFKSNQSTSHTLPRFLIIYAAVAIWHILVLSIWTDYLGLLYPAGYILATLGSMTLTFLGSRYFVFLTDISKHT
jgi:putative flippase GtrA